METTLPIRDIIERNICWDHGGRRDEHCGWCHHLDALQPTLPGFTAAELEAACT